MSIRAFLLAACLIASFTTSAQVPDVLSGTWAGASMESGTPRLFTLQMTVAGDSLTTTLIQPERGYWTFG